MRNIYYEFYNMTLSNHKLSMAKIIVISVCLFMMMFTQQASAQEKSLALMPYPQSVKLLPEQYTLTKNVQLKVQGVHEKRQSFINKRVVSQFAKLGHQVIQQPSVDSEGFSKINLIINQGKAHENYQPTLNNDESYQLKISQQGIDILANNDFGALHGLATLMQLIAANNSSQITILPQVVINDFPRFPWRGLMIDSVRHFISVKAIKRQLDGMAIAKLNVFHWHLTDDQGWRFESKAYPKLHKLASDGQYYSQQEIKDVVHYASQLGIRVVPEFDVPGHASAIAVAYPELITEKKRYSMEDGWGVFDPLLDPSNPDVYVFIDKIVAEFTSLFPDEYLHIGGDEVHPIQWQKSEAVQQYMAENNVKDSHELQVHFNEKVQTILTKHQRKMMGWDEIYHPKLPKDIMVQSWRGMESLSQIAANQYQGLLSTGFYIDQPQSSAYHYRNELLAKRPNAVVTPSSEDTISAWQFTMPRLKGNAVQGTLAMVSRNNYLIHAYVKLNNNHYQKVQLERQLTLQQTQINFTVDSWMGPTRGEFDLSDPTTLTGRILVGNAHYDVQGQQINEFDFTSVKLLPNILPEHEKNILGGEATLWTELVTEKNIDLRIWPRTFAIAERLWSAKSRQNINQMYQRLFKINASAAKLGLHHLQQNINGIRGLVFPETRLSSLMMLAEQLEPAHYYTRHHLKFKKGQYHQRAGLNSFVDYLPTESLALVSMQQQLYAFKGGDKAGLQTIVNTMRQWHTSYDEAIKIIKKNPKLSTLTEVVYDVRTINTLGLTVAHSCLAGVKIRTPEVKRIKQHLANLHRNVREISLASGLFVEKLLDACKA
ncbi:family 20 glycosylhydrolase [Colwellia sp. 1_MG-2023]|uniref:beta-N-acetylhexosaminidase n=1 Tax=Colwellia sp. 1_MG-2023 TaxID=3062649 RepID=UPI0026E3C7A0|nr:family 20 glycosylhydrolase [Colwellia sp. 1_MG-2023]MDO6445502.1 family 20 glycosylhydrolase [Colwellia sp. 1_MG-2023]